MCLLRRRRGCLDGRSFFAQLFEGAVDEGAHVPSVDVFEGRFACCVVAAGKDAGLEVDSVALESIDDLERVFAGKCQVVVGVDEQGFFGLFRRLGSGGLDAHELVVVVDGADGGPELAEAFLCKTGVRKTLTDVARALACPYDIAEGCGGVVEGVDAQARIVCGSEKGIARA